MYNGGAEGTYFFFTYQADPKNIKTKKESKVPGWDKDF
jgi:hypothetical protein